MQGEISKNSTLIPQIAEKEDYRNRNKAKYRKRWDELSKEGHILRACLKSGAVKIDYAALSARKDITYRLTKLSLIIEIPIEEIPFLENKTN
jgi:hypothetical protein